MDLTTDSAVFFDGAWSDLDGGLNNFNSTVLSDSLWKKFELVETPPLSPLRLDEGYVSPIDPISCFSFTPPHTPPDSEDEVEPLAGEDCMWSCPSSPVPILRQASTAPVNSSSNSPPKDVQLKFKLTDEAAAEKPFPYPLSEQVIPQPTALKRPADSDGEEEVDVVSVEVEPHKRRSSSESSSLANVNSTTDTNVCTSPTANPLDSVFLTPRKSSSLPTTPVIRPPSAKRVRRERSGSGRLSSHDLDDNDESKRATHNVLERRRREDLKLLYANLRKCLPALVSNERAAKVKILEHAHAYVVQLNASVAKNERDIALEERRNIYLHQLLADTRSRKHN